MNDEYPEKIKSALKQTNATTSTQNALTFEQLLQIKSEFKLLEDKLNDIQRSLNFNRIIMLEDKLNNIQRSLNFNKIIGAFIVLVLFFDYLVDMGWL
jgi:hypothetical protein